MTPKRQEVGNENKSNCGQCTHWERIKGRLDSSLVYGICQYPDQMRWVNHRNHSACGRVELETERRGALEP